MNEGPFLSKLLLVISILVLVFAFLIFPAILNNPNSDINLSTLKDVWDSGNFELPVITKLSISFTENSVIRYIIFAILVLIGILTEIYAVDKKNSGLLHALNLVIGMLISTLFLLSLVIPFMPL